MEQKIWFNVNKVSKIELSYESLIEKNYYPSKSRGRFKFLWLIPLWKKSNLPERWATDEDADWYTDDSEYTFSDSYTIKGDPKKVYYKPWVRVHLGYKDEVFTRFETDEEAEDFVDLVLSQSDHVFEVIKNK